MLSLSSVLLMALYVSLLLWPFGALFASMGLGTPAISNALRLLVFSITGAVIGRFAPPSWRNRLALLALAMLFAGSLLIQFVLLLIPVTISCAGAYYLSFRSAQKKFDEAFTVHFLLTGLLLYGIVYIFVFVLDPSLLTVFGICCALFLIASLLIMNRVSLRDAANKGRADKAVRRLLPGNTAMTAGIVIVVIFLVLIKPLSDGVGILIGYLGTLLGYAYKFFTAGTHGSNHAPNDDGSAPDMSDVGEGKSISLPFLEKMFEILGNVLLVLAFIAVFALILYVLYRLIRLLVKSVNSWFNRHAGEGYNSEYTEESEQLLSWENARKEILDRFRENVKKTFRREPKWEELPDDRTRVRTAYQHALAAHVKLHHEAVNQTPEQMIREMAGHNLTLDRDAFARSYNKARYSEHDLTLEEVQNARNAF